MREIIAIELSGDPLYLGQGTFGKIYKQFYDGQEVAVKEYLPDPNRPLRAQILFERESFAMDGLVHENVVKLHGAVTFPNASKGLVLEYCANGDLLHYMVKEGIKWSATKRCMDISLELARGVAYIHGRGLTHNDLKPDNIFLDSDFHVKIGDFGCAKWGNYSTSTPAGSIAWTAPELIAASLNGTIATFTAASDEYALGLILWAMYSLKNPTAGVSRQARKDLRAIAVARSEGGKEDDSCITRPVVRGLCCLLWDKDPKQRPTADEVVKVLDDARKLEFSTN